MEELEAEGLGAEDSEVVARGLGVEDSDLEAEDLEATAVDTAD